MSAPRFICCAALLAAFLLAPNSLTAQMGVTSPMVPVPAVSTASPPQTSLPIFGTDSPNPLERALATRTSLQFESGVTVEVFANYLSETYRINVDIDQRALDDVGLGTDTPIKRVDYRDVTLEAGLELVLDELDLCFMVRDVVLVITTPEEAENHLDTHVYPVGDLLFWAETRNVIYADYDTLIETITSSIDPDTWDEVGGAGSIEAHPYTQSLVISQTRRVHRQIRALVETLRRAKRIQPPVNPMKLPARNVGSVPYRPGTTPAGGMWQTPYYNMGGFF